MSKLLAEGTGHEDELSIRHHGSKSRDLLHRTRDEASDRVENILEVWLPWGSALASVKVPGRSPALESIPPATPCGLDGGQGLPGRVKRLKVAKQDAIRRTYPPYI